ncbi:hypothetical protein TNCV_3801301 [Trichonephila clavipes]|nr:hypothetical protein TNCV_3801301 [Trichonephila clavipes]
MLPLYPPSACCFCSHHTHTAAVATRGLYCLGRNRKLITSRKTGRIYPWRQMGVSCIGSIRHHIALECFRSNMDCETSGTIVNLEPPKGYCYGVVTNLYGTFITNTLRRLWGL